MKSLARYSSFVSPCRIHTLVVPIGKWKRKDFNEAVSKLNEFNEVRLLDITPFDSPLFTPQGFPQGRLFFDFNIQGHNDSLDLFLYDFEPFRKTFIVIGLVNDSSNATKNFEVLKEKYSTIISHNLIYTSDIGSINELNVFVSDLNASSNIETIICDIGKSFLESLSHYYSSYKHVTLRSPGSVGGNTILKASLTKHSARHIYTRSPSTNNASTMSSKRLSSIEMATNNIKRATSMKLASSLSTSDSRAQQRAKGRQMKILGNFQLLAGRYTDALETFTESVVILHKIRDYLWLGSAFDGIAICFILLSYLEIPFQIPEIVDSLCPIEITNSPSESNTPRNSVSLSQFQSPRSSINFSPNSFTADSENVNLPILIKSISEKVLYYYDLSLPHNSEYAPQVVYANCLVKILTFMVSCSASDTLSSEVLTTIVHGTLVKPDLTIGNIENALFLREEIYSFSNRIFDLQLKNMDAEAQCTIYITLALVYKSLGFERKEAFVLRLLLVSLVANEENLYRYSDFKELFSTILTLYKIKEYKPKDAKASVSNQSWILLQKNVLQVCLKVAEKAGNERYITKISVMLLSQYAHTLNSIEQKSIFKKYIRPSIVNGRIDSYWDPYILRGISLRRLEFDQPGTTSATIPVESEIQNTKNQNKSFDDSKVFNPFKKQNDNSITHTSDLESMNNTFLIGDRAEIIFVVQNPFKFEVEISQVQLCGSISEFCEFREEPYISHENPFKINPESIVSITLPLTFRKATHQEYITSDSVSFSLYGLSFTEYKCAPYERENLKYIENQQNEQFKYGATIIKILPEQPHIEILNSSSFVPISLMILDGTKTTYPVMIHNKSLNCAVDYLNFKTVTNIELSMKSDYWKNVRADDLFSLEKKLQWLENSAIQIMDCPKRLGPNETFEVELEIDTSGIPLDFNSFDLVIEYGMTSKDNSRLYAKECRVTFDVTLTKTIEVSSVDVIPVNETMVQENGGPTWLKYIHKSLAADKSLHYFDFALFLIDVRNSCLNAVSLEIQFSDYKSVISNIESNHSSRVIVPVKKISYLTKDLAKMPVPTITKGRQFIQSGLKKNQEIEMRESFWCTEYILENLKCTWVPFDRSSMVGSVSFRKFFRIFDSKMVSILYQGSASYNILTSTESHENKVGDRINIKAVITPSSPKKIVKEDSLIVTLTIFDKLTLKLLSKSNKRILYNGSLMDYIDPNITSKVSFELLVLERGHYEICVALSRMQDPDHIVPANSNPVSLLVS
ncbi:hypothetical protein KAFR_0E03430 [Kazachstania africana CBS 2517]|uniref:Uncharacterized protein n=1 Tax=Kazachstania africana (strain ATCC 22294 / BCRC 22015 / CBS 2517 / CECT 1963 / NBRC 1671 / NRRL Y-8276) TaxID=1071382 RepID=H2AVU5_KAZAF|nr:hypothetical protein KAFR_0E03430 [Kazachstania africana CBS 2517]CCF58495.1 hypothetical protein KAFR_0E03430 [Kazachstania africana CBS 2517]